MQGGAGQSPGGPVLPIAGNYSKGTSEIAQSSDSSCSITALPWYMQEELTGPPCLVGSFHNTEGKAGLGRVINSEKQRRPAPKQDGKRCSLAPAKCPSVGLPWAPNHIYWVIQTCSVYITMMYQIWISQYSTTEPASNPVQGQSLGRMVIATALFVLSHVSFQKPSKYLKVTILSQLSSQHYQESTQAPTSPEKWFWTERGPQWRRQEAVTDWDQGDLHPRLCLRRATDVYICSMANLHLCTGGNGFSTLLP